MQVTTGADGRPRYLFAEANREHGTLIDYTGLPAHACDGEDLGRELVVEYGVPPEHAQDAIAHTRRITEMIDDHFGILVNPTIVVRNFRERLGPLETRRFVAPWVNTRLESAVPLPPEEQFLWIDVDTLLPVRWEAADFGMLSDWGLTFTYDPALMLRPPDGVVAPTCVPN